MPADPRTLGTQAAAATRLHPGAVPVPQRLTLSVIVPVFDEKGTILEILARVARRPEVDEMVVIDDCSRDGTREILQAEAAAGWATVASAIDRPLPAMQLLVHERNRGKGAALRTGFAAATGDVLLTQDADLEYDPADYPKLLEPILDGRADAVFGSRFAGYPRRVLFFWHMVANTLLTLLSNMFSDLNLTDMETGYKVIRREMIEGMTLRAERFGIEPELTARLSECEARIYEVPISYSGRSYQDGKKIGWKDAVSALWTILRCALTDGRRGKMAMRTTLRRVSRLHRLHAFLLERVSGAIGRRVLEVGAGFGAATRWLAARGCEVVASDVDRELVDLLAERFRSTDGVSTAVLDIAEDIPERFADARFDTVVCMNVLEQLDGDGAAVARLATLLEPGGSLILQVPAGPGLFGSIDTALGHRRRYQRADVEALFRGAGLRVETIEPVNAISIPGWWLSGGPFQRRAVPWVPARIADFAVPIMQLERALRVPVGLSWLAVGRRPARPEASFPVG